MNRNVGKNMTWVEYVGFCGSGLAVWTYWMREMIQLRIVAVIGCLCFLTYGALIESYPIMLMEVTLLPINAYRLFQLLRARAFAANPAA
jgi:Bacterial inner membrane protein